MAPVTRAPLLRSRPPLPMVHSGNLTVIDQNEPLLMELEPQDLVFLLELPANQRLGHIVSLNRTARYANRLNAFALLERLGQADASITESHG